MSTQPEALRLAELFEIEADLESLYRKAAAELRRLHQFSEDQIGRATAAEAALQMTKATHALKIAAVEAQRDALLETLRQIEPILARMYGIQAADLPPMQAVRAAIAKAEDER